MKISNISSYNMGIALPLQQEVFLLQLETQRFTLKLGSVENELN